MRTRMLRAAVATLAGSVLLIPTAASAGPVCEEIVHEGVEPVADIVGLGGVVHDVETAACPLLP